MSVLVLRLGASVFEPGLVESNSRSVHDMQAAAAQPQIFSGGVAREASLTARRAAEPHH